MPPFRYLGNILGCAGVRFLLGRGVCFGLGAGAPMRSRARIGGLVLVGGRCSFFEIRWFARFGFD